MTTTAPLADVLAEARRLVALADARDVAMRLLGGTAIHLRAGDGLLSLLRRAPQDIDVAVPAGTGGRIADLLVSGGYSPDEQFNLLEGARRLLFLDAANGRQVDVFVSEFEMCHRIPIAGRLLLEPMTIPLAELLLTKLQIVKLNAKDELDVYAMLHAHDVADSDGDTINHARIAEVCAGDWGLHRTVTLNLERLRTRLAAHQLPREEVDRIRSRLQRLATAIEHAPKSARWRLRARVGERMRWYEDPEEIGTA